MKPNIVVYCCINATGVAEEAVDACIAEGKADIKMTRLPCSGRTDVLYLVRAMEEGADMALVAACPEGTCKYLQGNIKAGQRVNYANRVLSEAGLGAERVRMVNLDPGKVESFAEALADTIAKASELGPWKSRQSAPQENSI